MFEKKKYIFFQLVLWFKIYLQLVLCLMFEEKNIFSVGSLVDV